MRYIIDTIDEEGIIGIQIDKWKKENKLNIIEKADPVIEIQVFLERVAKALEVLKKAGYNSAVMESWIYDQTKESKSRIRAILDSQEEFFRKIGVLKK